jgi:hypothetical protein
VRSFPNPVITPMAFDCARRVTYPGVVNDGQTWALIGLLAATFFGLFAEGRSERKELRAGIAAIRGDLSELKVLVGRMDERLKSLEAR